jgi:hypothetical protein
MELVSIRGGLRKVRVSQFEFYLSQNNLGETKYYFSSPTLIGKISTPSRKIEKVQKHLEKYPLFSHSESN